MRSEAKAGMTIAELATKYHVSKTSIWRIQKRETWAHA